MTSVVPTANPARYRCGVDAGLTPTKGVPAIAGDRAASVDRDLSFLSRSPHGAADAYLELRRLRTGFHDKLGRDPGSVGLAAILLGSVGLFVTPAAIVFSFVGFGLLVVHTRSEATGGTLGGLSSPRLSDRLVRHLDRWVDGHPELLHLEDSAIRTSVSAEIARYASSHLAPH